MADQVTEVVLDPASKGEPSVTNLFVANLPESAKDDELRSMFSTFGKILTCKVMVDFNTGKSRGFGFVKFETEAQGAVSLLLQQC